MSTNPLINQGTLNRLRTAVQIPLLPSLQITTGYLGKNGVSISFDGDMSQLIGTMTGGVSSPEPYVMATLTIHLVRSQSLAQAWQEQIQLATYLGLVNLVGDSNTMDDYTLLNAVLKSVKEIAFDGTQAEYVITIQGIYPINSLLWATT